MGHLLETMWILVRGVTMGLLFVLFMPTVGFGLLFWELGKKVVELLRRATSAMTAYNN